MLRGMFYVEREEIMYQISFAKLPPWNYSSHNALEDVKRNFHVRATT